jgi:CheY-like chemotaxis protein
MAQFAFESKTALQSQAFTADTTIFMAITPTVLVVDDVDATRQGLSQLLRLLGYDTREAANGVEALERLREDPHIRVVVLDLLMPGTNGFWFREQQLKDPAIAHIPAIVFSGRELRSEEVTETLKAAAVFQKPVSADALCEAVSRYCNV